MTDEERLSLCRDDRGVDARLAVAVSLLLRLLPDAEVEHVGSTAVPGCLTKGDIDVLVRVGADAFPDAMRTLDAALHRGEDNESTSDYIEYDHRVDEGHVSIQLVVAGSWHDRCFAGFKRALLADPALVARYNGLKHEHDGHPMEQYRRAKAAFIESALKDKVGRVTAEAIEIVDYDPRWPEAFELERQHLTVLFPQGLVVRIEHVGSTAVPGLGAKPVVDILVGVRDLAVVREHVAPLLEAQGYDYFWRPTHGDDVPPFYAFFIKRDAAGVRTHHVHVVEMDFREHWDWVLFRDYLRAHTEVAAEYERLKRKLAAEFSRDRVRYTEEKAGFILAALGEARGDRGAAGDDERGVS